MTELESSEIERIKIRIIKIIEERKPETIIQLIEQVKKELEIPDKQLLFIIQELEDEKRLQFSDLVFPESTIDYVFSLKAAWYWVILSLSILTAILVFVIPENLVPQVYARSALALIFILYFPGYVIIKAIYPINVPLELRSTVLDGVERILLSLGLSLAVTPLIGLILYFTPLGLTILSTTSSLLAITAAFSTLAVWREYHARKDIFLRRIIVVTEYQFSDNAIKFFVMAGFLKNQLVLVKQIPIKEIKSVESFGNELSITSNGITEIFYMKFDSKTVTELREKILSML